MQYVVFVFSSATPGADDSGIFQVWKRKRAFLPTILPPQAASHCNRSFPRKRSSFSPLSSRPRSAATLLPFRPSSTSSCASGSTRERSDGQSSFFFLREVPQGRRAPVLPTRPRSSSIWWALLENVPFLRPSKSYSVLNVAPVGPWLSCKAASFSYVKKRTDVDSKSTSTLLILFLLPSSTRNISVINSVSPFPASVVSLLNTVRPKDVAFHAITTAWLRKWMHAEPISEQLVKENIPGDDRVDTFDEWAAYARSNAIVNLPPYPCLGHLKISDTLRCVRTVDFPSYRNGGACARVFTR